MIPSTDLSLTVRPCTNILIYTRLVFQEEKGVTPTADLCSYAGRSHRPQTVQHSTCTRFLVFVFVFNRDNNNYVWYIRGVWWFKSILAVLYAYESYIRSGSPLRCNAQQCTANACSLVVRNVTNAYMNECKFLHET